MPKKTFLPVSLAMLAFAGNSLLNRIALREELVDAASFGTLRLAAGALFVYIAGFSFAYVSLSAATGALLLFGAVQATMLAWGFWHGERLSRMQCAGLLLALAGVAALLIPEFSTPAFGSSLLMLLAGIAWGAYSLAGRSSNSPTLATAGNFILALPLALGLSLLCLPNMNITLSGLLYACLSGALASGAGYALWYAALPSLSATSAASLQLSVPVLAAIGGSLLLNEPLTFQLLLTACAILAGISLVILGKHSVPGA